MALFAALLQLAMGMQSLQHQVGMAGQADLLAVCTPTGITWVAADAQGGDEPDPVPAAQSQCVVCAAAAFLPLLRYHHCSIGNKNISQFPYKSKGIYLLPLPSAKRLIDILSAPVVVALIFLLSYAVIFQPASHSGGTMG